VGTVWNGLSKLTIADLVPTLRKQMGIPDDHLIGYAMGFGWPAVRYARTAPRPGPMINRVNLDG
jgi:pimeloyl-ACP methyl ester carboxylesterase